MTTNIKPEMRAILEALIHYNIVNEVQHVPWDFMDKVKEIKMIMTTLDTIITYVHRKGNKLIDYLANLATELDTMQEFRSFQQLLSIGRKIINIDKAQISTNRIRSRKIKPYSQSFSIGVMTLQVIYFISNCFQCFEHSHSIYRLFMTFQDHRFSF